ncbi:MAG: hypothetical protein JNN20_07095 [Betaproteobacteria bacterium]|nr:hypothetical protein [Betaproteobacteria bacterium]
MDDGPFHGRAVSKMPTSAATQIFPVRDFVLEIYAPETSTEAPVVLLRKPDKSVAWAIHAEGMGNTKVESIEFSEYQTMLDITVLGHVKWTFGNEATTWVIGRDGTLKEYWYSW